VEAVIEKFLITVDGLAPILFDRFYDHSQEARPAEQKMYYSSRNKNHLIMPSENIIAFLLGEYPPGCAKAFEKKKSKEYIQIGAQIQITPTEIPFLDDNDRPVVFNGFEDPRFSIVLVGGRTRKGSSSIKQEAKPRPVLNLPWRLKFELSLWKNHLIDENKLRNWFEAGGFQLAVGSWRPRYGRFMVSDWKRI
jgi:hypothetical protein